MFIVFWVYETHNQVHVLHPLSCSLPVRRAKARWGPPYHPCSHTMAEAEADVFLPPDFSFDDPCRAPAPPRTGKRHRGVPDPDPDPDDDTNAGVDADTADRGSTRRHHRHRHNEERDRRSPSPDTHRDTAAGAAPRRVAPGGAPTSYSGKHVKHVRGYVRRPRVREDGIGGNPMGGAAQAAYVFVGPAEDGSWGRGRGTQADTGNYNGEDSECGSGAMTADPRQFHVPVDLTRYRVPEPQAQEVVAAQHDMADAQIRNHVAYKLAARIRRVCTKARIVEDYIHARRSRGATETSVDKAPSVPPVGLSNVAMPPPVAILPVHAQGPDGNAAPVSGILLGSGQEGRRSTETQVPPVAPGQGLGLAPGTGPGPGADTNPLVDPISKAGAVLGGCVGVGPGGAALAKSPFSPLDGETPTQFPQGADFGTRVAVSRVVVEDISALSDSDGELDLDLESVELPLFPTTDVSIAMHIAALMTTGRTMEEAITVATDPETRARHESHPLLPDATTDITRVFEVLRAAGNPACFLLHLDVPSIVAATRRVRQARLTAREKTLVRERLGHEEEPFKRAFLLDTMRTNHSGRANLSRPDSPGFCMLCDIKAEDLTPTTDGSTDPVTAGMLCAARSALHSITCLLSDPSLVCRPEVMYSEIVGIYDTSILPHLRHNRDSRFSHMVTLYGPTCLHLTVDAVRAHHENDMEVSPLVVRRRIARETGILAMSFIDDALKKGVHGPHAIDTGMKLIRLFYTLSGDLMPPTRRQVPRNVATRALTRSGPGNGGGNGPRPTH